MRRSYIKLILSLSLFTLASCTQLANQQKSTAKDSVSENPYVHSACQKLMANPNDWSALKDTPKETAHIWQHFYEHNALPKKIAIFIDGTGNTKQSNTNIWKLYTLATAKACQNKDIIPYYHTGVGTQLGNKIFGGITGKGVDGLIKDAYQFLATTYPSTAEETQNTVYIFGFSRGAYVARSLNGFIEFAGLLDIRKLPSEKKQRQYINTLYKLYKQKNDGEPRFAARLKEQISVGRKAFDIPVYSNAESLSPTFLVEAMGVFDTVPALGLTRDDNPDNHRTELYARRGYHALAIDEQRDDFRPLRFDDRITSQQHLIEVWFAGAHADVGGGYGDEFGLEWLARDWMLHQFEEDDLFASESHQSCADCVASCERGQLHDEFLRERSFFRAFGIHWRKPLKGDTLHCSVKKRLTLQQLPLPHEKEEPEGVYQPENLYPNIDEAYLFDTTPAHYCLEE